MIGAQSSDICTDCVAGTYASEGSATCMRCAAGTYSLDRASVCDQCIAGKFSIVLGAQSADTCTFCPKFAGKFATVSSENDYNTRSTTIGTGTASADGCICGLDSKGIQLVQDTLQASSLSPVGSNRVCLCGKGYVISNKQLPTCALSPANFYQPRVGGDSKSCPPNSNSPAGGDSLDDCKCNAGFSPDPVFDANGVQINFNCYCDPGYYENGAACVKCQTCDPGWYRSGCQRNSAGVCVQCSCPVFWMVQQSKPSG